MVETKFIYFVIRCRKVRQKPSLGAGNVGCKGNFRINALGLPALPVAKLHFSL